MKRILILRGGALGDFMVTLPVLAALQRQWPEAVLFLAARPSLGRLALAAGLVHAVIPLESAQMSRFFADMPEAPDDDSAFVGSLDLAVSFLADGDGVLERNMRRMGLRRWLAIPSRVKQGHATDHFLAPLIHAGYVASEHADPIPRLVLPSDRITRGRVRISERTGNLGPWAFLHPGSGSPSKNWPVESFLVLACLLARYCGLQPVFLAGEADDAVVSRLRERGMPYPLFHHLELDELASMLAAGRIYVGNDSGVTHLAAALGIPTMALFGPTDPAQWAPRGPRVHVVRSVPATTEGLRSLSPEEVFGQVVFALEPRGLAGSLDRPSSDR